MGYNPDIHKHPLHLFLNLSDQQLLELDWLLVHYFHELIENDRMSEPSFGLCQDFFAHTLSEIDRRKKGGLWMTEEEVLKRLKRGY